MKKVLVVGCKGMAGHVVKIYLERTRNFDVWGLARNVKSESNLINVDVTDIDELENILKIGAFDVVINCIGLLNNAAENNPELAVWFNSYFPQLLASFGVKYNFKLIHLSTDCVFSGKEGGYTEDSFKDGIGFYAQSKALGEVTNNKHLTFRTSIIGPELKKEGIGLFHWFMNQSGVISGFTEAYWTGVTTIELAKAINESIVQELTGLYHLTNNSRISKHELLLILNRLFRSNEVEITPINDYRIDKSLINSRKDFDHITPSYTCMIDEMKEWMLRYSRLYNHYKAKSELDNSLF
mgnify:CR=1 FL=1